MQRWIANQKVHIQPLIKQNAKGVIANTDYSQHPQSHCFAHCFTKTAGKRAHLQRSDKGTKKIDCHHDNQSFTNLKSNTMKNIAKVQDYRISSNTLPQ